MSDKNQFEIEYEIDLSSPDLDITRGVDVGIQIEKLGKQFYEYHAEKLKDTGLHSFLIFLAKEEEKHIKILTELKHSLKSSGNWVVLKHDGQIEEMLKRVDVFKKNDVPKEKAADVDILMKSIITEKNTRDFYLRFSENAKNQKGKDFFRRLADWENSHYELLSELLEAETQFRMQS